VPATSTHTVTQNASIKYANTIHQPTHTTTVQYPTLQQDIMEWVAAQDAPIHTHMIITTIQSQSLALGEPVPKTLMGFSNTGSKTIHADTTV
jgi:hypothetical protein